MDGYLCSGTAGICTGPGQHVHILQLTGSEPKSTVIPVRRINLDAQFNPTVPLVIGPILV